MEPTIHCEPDEFLALGQDLLERGTTLRFRARGSSMRPLIRDGDVVDVIPCAAADLAVGDVILFRSAGGRPLVHRLLALGRTEDGALRLRTKGDAPGRVDAPIGAEQVLGRVVAVRGDDGRLRALDRGLYGRLGRLLAHLQAHYPGLVQRARPLLRAVRARLPRGTWE